MPGSADSGRAEGQPLDAGELNLVEDHLERYRFVRPSWSTRAGALVVAGLAAPGLIWIMTSRDRNEPVDSWWSAVGIVGAVLVAPLLVAAVSKYVLTRLIERGDRYPFGLEEHMVEQGAIVEGMLASAAPAQLAVVVLTKRVESYTDGEGELDSKTNFYQHQIAKIRPGQSAFDGQIPRNTKPSGNGGGGDDHRAHWIRVEAHDRRAVSPLFVFAKSDRPIYLVETTDRQPDE